MHYLLRASGRYQLIRERAAFSITSTLISDFAKGLLPARIRLSVSKTLMPLDQGAGREWPSTHSRESHLLPLVERLVEVRERGVDRGGGGTHGG